MAQRMKCMLGLVVILWAVQADAGFGVRGTAGYGFGLNRMPFGTGDRAIGGHYSATMANGLAWGLEALFSKNGKIEFGLGVFAPLALDVSESSSIGTASVTLSDETTLRASHLPVIAMVYLRQPLSGKWSLFSGLGAGVVLPGDYEYSSTYTAAPIPGTPMHQMADQTIEMKMAAAFRGVFGAEVALSPKLSLYGAAGLIASSLSPSSSTRTVTNTVDDDVDTEIITYQDELPVPLLAPPVTVVDTRVGGTGIVVIDTDDGINRLHEVRTYSGGILMKTETTRETRVVKESWGVDQLSFQVGLTYRF